MQPTPDAAQLAESLSEQLQRDLPALAALYDRFANALDPFSPDRDQAERVFMAEVLDLHRVVLQRPKPDFQLFRGAIVLACRRHLAATRKPATPPPCAYHNGAAGLAFADGHSEIKKWLDRRTMPPIKPGVELPSLNVPSPNNPDALWLMDRSTRKR